MMTPPRGLSVPRWVALAVAMLPLGAVVIAAARYGYHAVTAVETRAHAESTYVAKTNYEKARIIDSLNYRMDIHDIRAVLVHLDSDVHNPRRKP